MYQSSSDRCTSPNLHNPDIVPCPGGSILQATEPSTSSGPALASSNGFLMQPPFNRTVIPPNGEDLNVDGIGTLQSGTVCGPNLLVSNSNTLSQDPVSTSAFVPNTAELHADQSVVSHDQISMSHDFVVSMSRDQTIMSHDQASLVPDCITMAHSDAIQLTHSESSLPPPTTTPCNPDCFDPDLQNIIQQFL